MVRCGWEVNLGRICLSMKRARGKKPEEINLAPASSSAAQNGKHQKRFVRCSPVISLKTVQLEVFLSVFVFLWTRVFFSLFLKHLNSRVLKASPYDWSNQLLCPFHSIWSDLSYGRMDNYDPMVKVMYLQSPTLMVF